MGILKKILKYILVFSLNILLFYGLMTLSVILYFISLGAVIGGEENYWWYFLPFVAIQLLTNFLLYKKRTFFNDLLLLRFNFFLIILLYLLVNVGSFQLAYHYTFK